MLPTIDQLIELRTAAHQPSMLRDFSSWSLWLYENENGKVSVSSDWKSSNTLPSVGRVVAESNPWSLADIEGYEGYDCENDPENYVAEEAREWAYFTLEQLEEIAEQEA